MTSFDDPNCTRIGRYSSGEFLGMHGGKHPIAQFLAGPSYTLNSKIDLKWGMGTTRIPEDAQRLPSRLEQFPEEQIEIVDVGCSTGGATLTLHEIVSSLTSKKVVTRGYDADEKLLEKTLKGESSYFSSGSLLHPLPLRSAMTHFNVTGVHPNKNKKAGYVNGFDDTYEFTIKSSSLPILTKMLNIGDGKNLPLADETSHLTICAFVLRYCGGDEQEDIFRELVRVTRPGGFIFTEEFAFQKEEKGVRYLSPLGEDAAVSFYNPSKVLFYNNFPPGEEHAKECFSHLVRDMA
ncbi:MAG TPA: class I SAM-dependent methyltransferase [Candidatus Nanoarchaeia archaeon]|nr:class I SAM-dependent methyltransferase [Candidatus Nanoarchaeia archaeon]